METVIDFSFLGSKITVNGDCSHEIKRCLLLGRKAMTNLDSVLKSRDITLLTKVHIVVKAMIFPVVMYVYESWTIKKAELKNWCFWIVVLEKTLESPLESKEVKPVNPKRNQPWIHIGKDPDAEKIESRRRRGQRGWDSWMALSTQWTRVWANPRRQCRTGKLGMLQSMGSQRVRRDWVSEHNNSSSKVIIGNLVSCRQNQGWFIL